MSNYTLPPLLLASVLLCACSGGSGGSAPVTNPPSTPAPGASNTPPAAPAPTTTPAPTTPTVTPAPTPSFRLFSAFGSVNEGRELWKTDGTSAGTVLLKDINPSGNSNPEAFVEVGVNKWFFLADNGTDGRELWFTDGTADGTRMVKDVRAGASGISTQELVAFKGGVAFGAFTTQFPNAGSKLWFSDGTEAGTIPISRIRPSGSNDSPSHIVAVGESLFFNADGPDGRELYSSNGTLAGTGLVKDIIPGTVPNVPLALSGNPQFLTAFNDKVFFTASLPNPPGAPIGPSLDLEPWVSDGTSAGTRILSSINPGSTGSFPSGWKVSGDRIYFIANGPTQGSAVWVSDGTTTGTSLLTDLNNRTGLNDVYNPRDLAATGNRRFFFIVGSDATGQELAYSDGTTAGSQIIDVRTGADGGFIENVTALGSKAVFTAQSSSTVQTELWVSDGTDAGTQRIKILNSTTRGQAKSFVASVFDDNRILFVANDGTTGDELWITDGTEAGTMLLKDINPDAGSSSPSFALTPAIPI